MEQTIKSYQNRTDIRVNRVTLEIQIRKQDDQSTYEAFLRSHAKLLTEKLMIKWFQLFNQNIKIFYQVSSMNICCTQKYFFLKEIVRYFSIFHPGHSKVQTSMFKSLAINYFVLKYRSTVT